MNKYKSYTYFILVFTFLVVLAGSIVRTTQSGMGCPDWPTCFGKWIPPLTVDDLPPDFEKYLSKQDIDHTFNAYHTWIEYINRLLGALLGLFIVIHFVWSVAKRQVYGNKIVWMSGLMLLLVGFSGWLGKLVVDSNLATTKISLHMISALLLAFVPVMILNLIDKVKIVLYNSAWLNRLSIFLFFILMIQLFLGIELREGIDEVSKKLGYLSRDTWLDFSGNIFYIHRSLSWLILGLSIVMWRMSKNAHSYVRHIKAFISLVLFLFVIGIGFSYAGFPAWLQPLHLLSSLVLITVTFDLLHKVYINWKR